MGTRVDRNKFALSKIKHAASRLAAQPLKFRITLTDIAAENLPANAKKVYFSWIRGGKDISTDHALVEDAKVEWRDELTQIVTIYYQVAGDGNLKATKKDYSLKIKDSRTRKTLGKVKVDFRKYCKLESQFNRSFVELSATAKVKVFLVVSSELVDEEQEDATTSPSPTSASDTRRTMSATFASPKTSLQDVGGDKANASGQTFSASMHEMASPSLASPDLIQQSIDILHSSSEEEEEEERGWQSKLQAIARRLTPKATPSGPPRRHTAPVGQAVTPPPVTTPQVSKALFAEREASRPVPVEAQAPLNPFGAPAMTSSSSEEGESLVDSDSTCRTPDSSKVVKEMELLRTQCDHLQSENALLKDRLVTQEKESAALRERLRQVQARAKEKVEEEGVGEGQGEGASNPFAGVAKMVSPRKNDMIEELITVKMKLAQAQSSLDELKRQQSQ